MTEKKVTDLLEEKIKKRRKEGWTQEEIEQLAIKEMLEYKKLDESEPENFASGDINKIFDEDVDDEKK